jgi:cytochrome c
MKSTIFASLAVLTMCAAPALADGDAAAGEQVFKKCAACHENAKGTNKVGPTLKGIVGRPVATAPAYTYSKAMMDKGATGAVWDEATLTAYLPDPKAFVPGTKMAFAGLKKPEDVANIIAFLKAHP